MTLSAYLEVCPSVLLQVVAPASGLRLAPTVSSLFSWTTASSPPSSLKTSLWCSTPGTPKSLLPVHSGTSLGVATPKLLTGKPASSSTLDFSIEIKTYFISILFAFCFVVGNFKIKTHYYLAAESLTCY